MTHAVRIHYYKQFFSGPHAPGSQQPRKLVWALAERGHEVQVIACDFNVYNEQTEPEEHEVLASGGSVRVHRLRAPRNIRRGLGARLQSYTAFARRAALLGRRLGPADVIVASVQPLFTAWSARKAARRFRIPWLLEVRDLWPDALEAKKAISWLQARPLHWLADSLYWSADRVVTVTPGIKQQLVKKGLPAGRVDVFPNGFDSNLFRIPSDTREQKRREMGWDSAFVALYAGAHTEVTAVETVVRAASALRGRGDIRFDLFGEGQTKPGLQLLARQMRLSNVHFHDPVPKAEVPALIAAADVCLMTLFESPLIDIYFENKLMDYMGAGKPILAAMGGMQAKLLRDYSAGLVVPAMDHEGLAKLVVEAATNPVGVARLGLNGRHLVEEHLILSDILDCYSTVIEAVAAGNAGLVPAWQPRL